MSSQQRIEVLPTGPRNANKLHTDIAISGLFNAQLSVVNSERQVIWMRYNSMLIANSIAFGFLTTLNESLNFEIIFGCTFGIILCFFWFLLTRAGWEWFYIWSECAGKFTWPKIDERVNPIVYQKEKLEKGSEAIKLLALSIIFLFIVGYLSLGVYIVIK